MPVVIPSEVAATETPSITLDDSEGNPVTLHETTKRCLALVTGLLGIGPLRDSRRVRPQAHGGIDETRWEDGRLINMEGEVFSPGDMADAYAEFRALAGVFLQTLDVAPALLKWTEAGSGLSLQRLVKLAGEVDPPIEEGAALLKYQAQFFAEDPRAYSQTLTTESSDALSEAAGGIIAPFTAPLLASQSSGGTVTLNNDGNRPTPPTFRVYGRCVDPAIVHVGSGTRIVLAGTVPAGSYLELDTQNRTVKMDGTTSQLGFLDSANSTWREASAGSTQWRLIASDFDEDCRLDVLARSAYA